jgi:SGNH hydrolase-like domain, acetyltransferase AlgX
MILRRRGRRLSPGALTAVAVLAVFSSSGCYPTRAHAPWAVSVKAVPAAHADVETLNLGYRRTRSGVLVRQVVRPTRAALDWAAYHANFMIADPPPEGTRAPFLAETALPFGGLIDVATLTGDIARTPLTEAERAYPLAFAPAVSFLAAHKVAGASALEEVAGNIRGETWGQPGPPNQANPGQAPSDLFLHDAGAGVPAELWIKIELAPWFASTTFKDAPDQDGDGVPEFFGRIHPGLVAPAAVEALRGEYSSRVLTTAEVKAWANQLSSYWYPSFNTDLVPTGPTWPDAQTEADIKQELGGRVFASPTFVLRGKPAGRAVYDVFVIGAEAAAAAAGGAPTAAGTGLGAGGAATVGPGALKLATTRVTPDPKPVAAAIARELGAHGGTWQAWQAQVAPFHKDLRGRLAAMPTGTKALAGADGFLFFRNSLEYVVGGDLGQQPKGKNPLPVIREFQQMLAAHGVDFLFVPVPTKVEIFPEKIEPGQGALTGQVVNPFSRKLLLDLSRDGVEVMDLLPAFLAARARADKRGEEPLYQHQDTHWTDRGLRMAAELIATRVKAYPWYPELAKHARRFRTRPAAFTRYGDLHSRLPEGQKARYKPESLQARQVLIDGRKPYDDDADSPVVVLGDSFTGVYELTEAEHAGVSAHIARAISYPVDLVMSYGGGPNVRQKLMRRGVEGLAGKKLVIWMMTARDLYNYWEDWTPLKVK